MMRWFHPDWYRYLFAPFPRAYDDEWFWRLRIVWCRLRGHPAGPVWFNVGGTEPDMHCRNCGDEI